MGVIVLACYHPHPGQGEELRKLVKNHFPLLRRRQLVTDRQPVVMEAGDGTVLEVFEWKSEEAVRAAHKDPEVGRLWEEFDKVCESIPVDQVEGAGKVFAHFTPLATD